MTPEEKMEIALRHANSVSEGCPGDAMWRTEGPEADVGLALSISLEEQGWTAAEFHEALLNLDARLIE